MINIEKKIYYFVKHSFGDVFSPMDIRTAQICLSFFLSNEEINLWENDLSSPS